MPLLVWRYRNTQVPARTPVFSAVGRRPASGKSTSSGRKASAVATPLRRTACGPVALSWVTGGEVAADDRQRSPAIQVPADRLPRRSPVPHRPDSTSLRGAQIADGSGAVRFTSIFPACYEAHWPRVHFEVYRDRADITYATKTIATSQLAFPQDVCDAVYATAGYESSVAKFRRVSLTPDSVFREDSAALQLATVSGDAAVGYREALPIGMDTRTAPRGGPR
jgi:hypothetical protein